MRKIRCRARLSHLKKRVVRVPRVRGRREEFLDSSTAVSGTWTFLAWTDGQAASLDSYVGRSWKYTVFELTSIAQRKKYELMRLLRAIKPHHHGVLNCLSIGRIQWGRSMQQKTLNCRFKLFGGLAFESRPISMYQKRTCFCQLSESLSISSRVTKTRKRQLSLLFESRLDVSERALTCTHATKRWLLSGDYT